MAKVIIFLLAAIIVSSLFIFALLWFFDRSEQRDHSKEMAREEHNREMMAQEFNYNHDDK